ncbi:hypothetical protein AYJ08_00315 [Brevibacillus sp. SKDU10]|uniref:hypothetical protein n=1 Tax=Brevibacillus sp. SKDU10 TaxID=1247872 RepID=UPI0007C95A6A|nr:hypothetical protein [Brevibacillus sp. SKDU10]OAJ75227.1 hypothetical protein AYJ08_00315 [Brevibacillus sp. SKDU10]
MSKNRIDLIGGLVSNWRELKAEIEKQSTPFNVYFYVYHEDDSEDACIFLSDAELIKWLKEKFYDWGYWESGNFYNCMNDIKVWKLISKNEVDCYPNLYCDAKPTSIVADGQQYYRIAIKISTELMISISLS